MRERVLLRYVAPLMAFGLVAFQCRAATTDRITIVGSSTVYPFSALVAEHFAKSGPFPSPAIRSTSTAEGFMLFCASAAMGTPDISNASRPISKAESEYCIRNGVQSIAEIRIGYDSLILASVLKVQTFNVTLGQLWRAVAQLVPIDGRLVANPYRTWHDIDPSLPLRPIRMIGPAPGHGTRDTFMELVMAPNCKAALAALPARTGHEEDACVAVREDGVWTNIDNMELILGKLASHPDAIGVLSYSYLEQFPNRIHAATVAGVGPSRNTIPSGVYPLSRPLFIYVKEAHLRTSVGLADYAAEFVSFCAAGAHGYLADEGLVPLPAPELLEQRAAVARLQR